MGFEQILIFFSAIALTACLTRIIRIIALKFQIVDRPGSDRKIHKRSVPLLGGTAIFISFFAILYFARGAALAGNLEPRHWLGMFIGACFLMIGGFLDDKYSLKPKMQIIFPMAAALAVIIGGVEIEKITNPLGGYLYLDQWRIPFLFAGGAARYFVIASDILIFVWLMGMMYTTKLLDGLDGLVSGVCAIGAIIIFLFTQTEQYFQPDIGIASLILAGCCFGFLAFNWHPAKIFLGEGGSLLLGFILGVLAIISGGKIAIALLIMGLPVLDVFWTIIRRLLIGKNPFKFSDRKHLHFRLLDSGIGHRKTVLIYYAFSAVFGLSAIFLQSLGKVIALLFLIIIMIVFILGFNLLDRKKQDL